MKRKIVFFCEFLLIFLASFFSSGLIVSCNFDALTPKERIVYVSLEPETKNDAEQNQEKNAAADEKKDGESQVSQPKEEKTDKSETIDVSDTEENNQNKNFERQLENKKDDAETELEAEKQSEDEHKTESEAQSGLQSESKSESKIQTENETESENQTALQSQKLEAQEQTQQQPQSQEQTQSQNQSESNSQTEQESQVGLQSGTEQLSQTEQQSQSESQTESVSQPQPQLQAQPVQQSTSQSDSQTEIASQTQTTSQSEQQTDQQTSSQSEQLSAQQPEPEPEIPMPAKLTLIIYMAADNDLEKYAIQNLKDMEHASYENINVIALVDRAEDYDETNGNWTDTRLLEIVHDDTDGGFLVSKRLDCPPLGLTARLRTELDMGNYNVLKNLITFAKSEYEAEQYALVIWGHGTGWRYRETPSYRAIGIDDKTDSYMSVCDMGKALENQNLAVIGFDTCFGGVFENLYELRDSCEYLVASPGVAPSSGWNYKKILETISQRDVSASDIANIMAENSLVHTTVINSSRLQGIMNALENFAEELAGTINDSSSRNDVFNMLFNAKSYSYSQYPCDMYIDMFDMAQLYIDSENQELAENAEKLRTAVSRAGHTNKSMTVEIGIHFIPLRSAHTANLYHSIDYLKDSSNLEQSAFIKNSNWWVPTINNDSGSLLDKIFY